MTTRQQPPVANVYRVDRHLGDRPGLLVVLDFDGTLSPIADDPDEPTITPGNRQALAALTDHPDTTVAVVSGRQLSDLRPRVGVEGVRYVGNHGLEYVVDGEREVHSEAADRVADIRAAREAVERRVADMPGVQVENKELTVTVHYRRARDATAAEVRELVDDVLSTTEGLEATDGKEIVEIRPEIDWDKGAVVEWLAEEAPEEWATVYVGDDTTDEDAFRVLGESDFGVLVGERSTAASYRVSAQCEVSRLLNWLLAVLDDADDGARD